MKIIPRFVINSKLLIWLLIIFSVFNIADAITAMFVLGGESNPIYLLTGSALSLWILKGLIIMLVFWVYFTNYYTTRFWLFTFIYSIIIGTVLTFTGVLSNIIGIMQPTIVSSAQVLTTSAKLTYYSYVVGAIAIMPYFVSVISFKIFDVVESKIRYPKKHVLKLRSKIR